MAKDRLSIGEVSKRTGIPVKTLRFYSDEGLLRETERSESGYRLYSETDIVRLDLIRTLRDAGIGLDSIRAVLKKDMTLSDALRLRLGAVEAHIASLRHVAAAIRAALRSEPTEQDIRRLCTVTRLSNEERKAVIERFYETVAEGIPVDKHWMRSMIEASAPKLPDDPSPEQIDAWVELAEIVSDPEFIDSIRENAREAWKPGFDMAALRTLNDDVLEVAKAARARNVTAESDEAGKLVAPYVAGLAGLGGRSIDEPGVRAGIRARFVRQDPRASRYWELVATLNGQHPMSSRVEEWKWIASAVIRFLDDATT